MPFLNRLFIPLLFLISAFFTQAIGANEAKVTKVLLETNKGNIELELYPDKAPATVANFLRYVDEGFYKGTIFHRVINSFMIQGGGFDAAMKKKNVHASIQNEADNGLKNQRGTVAMARTSDPHSATAQFFINHADNDFLNHTNRSKRGWGYCVFGRVSKGMKTIDAIADVFTTRVNGMKNVPEETVIITGAKRI
ncbi:MAG: peptidyl-prolyl cis-trans isomerase [Gammaproteobacteria bacterium]|nr:peptidyl-prolyl cis-trans isomerase [Gammaproteobacteria bacterium]